MKAGVCEKMGCVKEEVCVKGWGVCAGVGWDVCACTYRILRWTPEGKCGG